jgi:endonuclease YncB( thermonuclease family)
MNSRRFTSGRRRPRGIFRLLAETLLAIGILTLILAAVTRWDAPALTAAPGQARAIDGDSLMLGTDEIRLWGIDAPELMQTCDAAGKPAPCGRQAREQLAAMLRGASLSCIGAGRDQYDRLLAVCRSGAVPDINARLVAEGHAFDFGGYPAEEAQAREAKRGVWAGQNERPRAYRQRNNGRAEAEAGAGLDWLRLAFKRLVVWGSLR